MFLNQLRKVAGAPQRSKAASKKPTRRSGQKEAADAETDGHSSDDDSDEEPWELKLLEELDGRLASASSVQEVPLPADASMREGNAGRKTSTVKLHVGLGQIVINEAGQHREDRMWHLFRLFNVPFESPSRASMHASRRRCGG